MIFNVTTNVVEKEVTVFDLLQMQSNIYQEQMSLLSMDSISTEAAITIEKIKSIIEKIKKFIRSLWKKVIITIRMKARNIKKAVLKEQDPVEWAKSQNVIVLNEDIINIFTTKFNDDNWELEERVKVLEKVIGALSKTKTKTPNTVNEFADLHKISWKVACELSVNLNSYGSYCNKFSPYDSNGDANQDVVDKFAEFSKLYRELVIKTNTMYDKILSTLPKTYPDENTDTLVYRCADHYQNMAEVLKPF